MQPMHLTHAGIAVCLEGIEPPGELGKKNQFKGTFYV